MGNWLKPTPPLARGRAVVQTPSVMARYLDDLRRAEQARALDRHFGRQPPEAGMFDNINVPEIPDPIAPDRAIGAAHRRWLEVAEMDRAMQPQPAPPLADMLLDNDRRRALIASRLGRLTPEQQARSLPVVGQQYAADQAAARAADIKYGRDVNTAMALGGAVALGAGAFGARMAQESGRNQQDAEILADLNMREQLSRDVRDIDVAGDDGVYVPDVYVGASADDIPDLFAEDALLPVTSDVDEIGLLDDINEIRVQLPQVQMRADMPRNYEPSSDSKLRSETLDMMASQGFLSGGGDPSPALRDAKTIFADDFQMGLTPDSPDDAVAAAPGPDSPVGRVVDLEDLPGPQMRSIRALIGGGIPESRARDIILKGYSMSPDEYRMVTGGRR
jgi:hypothetical protein